MLHRSCVFAESLTSSIAAAHFLTTKLMGNFPHGRLMIESSQYAPTIELASRLRQRDPSLLLALINSSIRNRKTAANFQSQFQVRFKECFWCGVVHGSMRDNVSRQQCKKSQNARP